MGNKVLQIGVTGGIGSGKSLVCRIFQTLDLPVYNADDRAKNLMVSNQELVRQIIQNFGKEAYTPEGKLNNIYLAKEVFHDDEKLSILNSLVHPKVAEDFKVWAHSNASFPYVIKEAALLVETGSYLDLDQLILVSAPEEIRLARVMLRDPHRTVSQIQNIIKKQLPESEKAKKAHHIIVNDNKTLLIPQVLNLHNKFLKRDT